VNVASRMESTSEPGRIHVSEAFANALSNAPASARAQAPSQEEQGTTDDSAQSAAQTAAQTTAPTTEVIAAFTTTYRGEVDVKGKGTMKTFWLEGK
ncbi:MAG: hypothetical protein J5I53_10755, partial [Bradyrhizobiaceae bacterium]|nr:hypothetical protein [Bradyrhizobiaceae bacterium]